MPEKSTLDLFNNALAELEQIVAELEVHENSDGADGLDKSLSEFEPNITNLESGVDLTGSKKLSGLNVNITPKK